MVLTFCSIHICFSQAFDDNFYFIIPVLKALVSVLMEIIRVVGLTLNFPHFNLFFLLFKKLLDQIFH